MTIRLTQARQLTPAERLAALERRADAHDQVFKPMAEQVAEMFEAWTKAKNINWFLVKLAVAIGSIVGFVGVVLTIAVAVVRLWTGH